jgi:hypothetical protein
VKILSWMNFVLGLWLLVAAFVLPGRTGAVMAEESVAGIAVMVLAYTAVVSHPRTGTSWSVAIAGLWILIVNYAMMSASTTNAMIVGGLVLVLGTANAIACHVPRRAHA